MKKLLLIVPALSILMVLLMPSLAYAAVNYNDVIDDHNFDNSNSMSASQIDAFLNSFPSSCISTNNGFSSPDPTGYNPSQGFLFGGNVSAGTVIHDAAQAYGINPQVLIATAQKEQSLITGSAGCYANTPSPSATVESTTSCGQVTASTPPDQITTSMCTDACPYSGGCINIALGYGCPYYCNVNDEGFSRQIITAAWLLTFDRHRSEGQNNWYENKPGWDNSDDLGFCYSGYDAEGGPYYLCPDQDSHASDPYVSHSGQYVIDGSTVVTMTNGATAALYDYTPHLHGQVLFSDNYTGWFGSAVAVQLTGSPGSVSWGYNRLDVFVRGSDGELWQKYYDGSAGGWGPWAALNIPLISSPTVSSWGVGRLDIFYVDSTGNLNHYWYGNGAWQSSESLGTPPGVGMGSDPAAVSWGPQRIDIFVRGTDGALWQETYDGPNGGWQPWVKIGGDIASSPTVSSWGPGRLDVFANGPAGDLEHFYFDGSVWHQAESLGTPAPGTTLTYAPGAVSWGPSRIDVFGRGSDGFLWQKWFDASGWHPWVRFGGVLNSAPTISSWGPQRLDEFSTGPANDLQHYWFSGQWGSWESFGQPVY